MQILPGMQMILSEKTAADQRAAHGSG
jgi:hypothetical protein